MIEKVNGGWRAKIVCDSISPQGHRLTTMEVRFPRIVLAEFNTHRMFSRNSASSRAIPVEKMIKMVEDDPFIPTYWGKNQKGMQANEEVSEGDIMRATKEWLIARDCAIISAESLIDLGIHKQLANRLLEPFLWHTVVVTATEWDNFFALRSNPAAAPEIRNASLLMESALAESVPRGIDYGGWHLPYLYEEDWEELEKWTKGPGKDELILDLSRQISVARCARVSYLTHDGKRDHQADVNLFQRLREAPHLSPFEHVATPIEIGEGDYMFWGNFKGWKQYRKFIRNEHDASKDQG